MRKHQWPTKIDLESLNKFTLAKFDPAVSPSEYVVTTWSNLFGEGGSITADAVMPDGKRVTLAQISVDRGGVVRAERDHLQTLIDEWDQDWSALVRAARSEVRHYYAAQMDEYGMKLAELDAEAAR